VVKKVPQPYRPEGQHPPPRLVVVFDLQRGRRVAVDRAHAAAGGGLGFPHAQQVVVARGEEVAAAVGGKVSRLARL
jgi:hypothetical protein